MKTIMRILVLGISLAAVSAMADETTTTNQAMALLTSQDFVTSATWAGDKEIALSQMALDKSQDADVTNFAARMIRDHTSANEKLAGIANKEGLSVPPTNSFAPENWQRLDTEDIKGLPAAALMRPTTGTNADLQLAKYLDSLSGVDFDRTYADCAVADHTQAVQLFTDASQTLDDKKLKRFAKKTLPVLRDHYDMAVELQNEVSTNTAATDMNSDTNSPH
jgi:putative membrane protein